jgi:hypothetical protein
MGATITGYTDPHSQARHVTLCVAPCKAPHSRPAELTSSRSRHAFGVLAGLRAALRAVLARPRACGRARPDVDP